MARRLVKRYGLWVFVTTLLAVPFLLSINPSADARSAVDPYEPAVNEGFYSALMSRLVATASELQDQVHLDILLCAPLLLPAEPWTMTFSGGVVPYGKNCLTREATKNLSLSSLFGVPCYSVVATIDPVTLESVFCDELSGEEAFRISPPMDFALLDLAMGGWGETVLSGMAGAGKLAPAPVNIGVQYYLMEERAVLPLAVQMSAVVPEVAAVAPVAPIMMMSQGSSSTFEITNITKTSSGMRIDVELADDWASTNDIDIFGTANLIESWWDVLATTNGSNSVSWTDSDSTNSSIAVRMYRVGDGETDSDGDGYTDAREELAYHSDPDNSNSYPITVSGSVTHSNTSQSGTIYVVVVTTSNSWSLGRSDDISSPGSFSIPGVPNLDEYWIRAWRDWKANGEVDPWEATGTAANCPISLTNATSNIVVTLTDPSTSVAGELTYTGRQSGVLYAIAVTSSNSWSTNNSDALSHSGTYYINGLSQTDYWVKAWIDADGNGLFDSDREASGTWTNNPLFLSNSVWDLDFELTDVDADADGMPDWWEISNFGNTNQTSNGDYDADNMPNSWEYEWWFCPTNAADAMDDKDSDGYPNVYEYKHDSDPWNVQIIPSPGSSSGGDDTPAATVTVVTNGTTIQAALDSVTNDYDIVLVEA